MIKKVITLLKSLLFPAKNVLVADSPYGYMAKRNPFEEMKRIIQITSPIKLP